MKTLAPVTRHVLAAGLVLSAILISTQPSCGAETKGWSEKMEQWQEKMSKKFHDTWKGLSGENKQKSVSTASVDLREEKDAYIVRLNLPDRDVDKVDIKLEAGALHIVAPAEDKVGRYEQTVALADVAPN